MYPKSKAQKLQFKAELKAVCIEIIQERINVAKAAMDLAQESANSEEKSSAGAKYETGRAMSQIERDRNARQMEMAQQEMMLIKNISCEVLYDVAVNGAVIQSADMIYFIASGLGALSLQGLRITVLSVKSPLAMALKGAKAGEEVVFCERPIAIRDVF